MNKEYKTIPFADVKIGQEFEDSRYAKTLNHLPWIKKKHDAYGTDCSAKPIQLKEGRFPQGCLVRTADCEELDFDTWQPIDTAPEDGTEILLSHDGFVFSGEYDLSYGRFGRFTHEGLVEHQHPTHWMPLPEPPKAKA